MYDLTAHNNCQLWIRAGSWMTSGNTISSLLDLSGNGRDMAGRLGLVSYPWLNYPAMLIAGRYLLYGTPYYPATAQNGRTIIFCGMLSPQGRAKDSFLFGYGSKSRYEFFSFQNSSGMARLHYGFYSVTDYYDAINLLPENIPFVLTGRLDATQRSVSYNGAIQTLGAYVDIDTQPHGLCIAGYNNTEEYDDSVGDSFWVFEAAAFDRYITDQEVSDITKGIRGSWEF